MPHLWMGRIGKALHGGCARSEPITILTNNTLINCPRWAAQCFHLSTRKGFLATAYLACPGGSKKDKSERKRPKNIDIECALEQDQLNRGRHVHALTETRLDLGWERTESHPHQQAMLNLSKYASMLLYRHQSMLRWGKKNKTRQSATERDLVFWLHVMSPVARRP